MHFIYFILSEQKQLNSLAVMTQYLTTSKYFLLIIIIRPSLLWIGTPIRVFQPVETIQESIFNFFLSFNQISSFSNTRH
jgi:hypothetical protein